MRIWKRDKWKTALKIRYGHFEYEVISFGLSNILTSFQDYINKILIEKLDIFIMVDLDNILIYTNETNHIKSIQWVFDQLRKHFLYVNLKKY